MLIALSFEIQFVILEVISAVTTYPSFLTSMDFTSALISDRLYLQTEDMAKKDGLTKIYNRIYFNQFYPDLKEEVKKSGDTFTVCMLDIVLNGAVCIHAPVYAAILLINTLFCKELVCVLCIIKQSLVL